MILLILFVSNPCAQQLKCGAALHEFLQTSIQTALDNMDGNSCMYNVPPFTYAIVLFLLLSVQNTIPNNAHHNLPSDDSFKDIARATRVPVFFEVWKDCIGKFGNINCGGIRQQLFIHLCRSHFVKHAVMHPPLINYSPPPGSTTVI